MPKKNNYSFFNIILSYTFFLLLIIVGYSIFMYNKKESATMVLVHQKQKLITDLLVTRDRLDVAIKENTDFKWDLILQKNKVSKLLKDVKDADVNQNEILKYKNEIDRLNQQEILFKKNTSELIKSNQKFRKKSHNFILILADAIKFNQSHIKSNTDLKKEIVKKAPLSVNNLKVYPMNISEKGNVINTINATKVNCLRLNFMVSASKNKASRLKKYYIQIIDSRGAVFGNKLVKKFGNSFLHYSVASTKVNFANKDVDLLKLIDGKKLKKGIYIVNIFDQNKIVAKAGFSLL